MKKPENFTNQHQALPCSEYIMKPKSETIREYYVGNGKPQGFIN